MKCSCGIIKDLLPLYVDHVCSDESKELIDQHLLECEHCKSYLNLLRESQDVEAAAYDEETESRKVKMMVRMKKKLLFRNILVAVFTVLILGVACTSVIHYLKRATVPISETKQMEVVYENGDLVLNITNAIWSGASGVRFTMTEDGKSYECVAVAMNTSKYEWSNGNLSSNRQSNLGPHFCNLVGLLFYYGQDWAMMFKTSKGMTGDFICMEGVQV